MNQFIPDNPRALLRIKPDNLLSFGPETAPLELENLNVLIGPNGAGKSNLIDALSLIARPLPCLSLRRMRTCAEFCGVEAA